MLVLALFASASVASSATVGAPVPAAVREALAQALTQTDGRVEVEEYVPSHGSTCEPERAEAAPVKGSGRVAVRVVGHQASGARCEAWAWALVRVSAPAQVLSRDVAADEPLTDATRSEEREVRIGHGVLTRVSSDSVASRHLPAGTVLTDDMLRVGPALGATVTVRLTVGDLRIEKPGRRTACAPGRFCVSLANGKRLEGRWDGSAVWVDSK